MEDFGKISDSRDNTFLYCQEKEVVRSKRKTQLVIGIPNETSRKENRICLTPESVQQLVEMGHRIILQREAGLKAHYTDREYCEAGACIAESSEEVYQADIILKSTSVSTSDTALMKERQIILSPLQLFDVKKEAITKMMQKKVTAVGYDIIKDAEGYYPIVRLTSEIAGNMSIILAAQLLGNASGGKGVILGGASGITPTEIIILGAGTLGEYAARTAMGLGATVKVFDPSLNRLRNIKEKLGQNLFTSVLHQPVLEKSLKTADVVIGAMRCFGNKDNIIIREEQVNLMKKGSVIIDLSIDHGGCIETVGPTTHEKPTYTYNGVIHYCVPNVLSGVSRTGSIAYSNVLLPLLKEIGYSGGFINNIRANSGLRNGVYLYNGIPTKEVIADKFGLIYRDIDLLIAAL